MNATFLPAKTSKRLLTIVGWWNIVFAVLHVIIIFMKGSGYRYFGAGEQMARAAETGNPKPTLITAGLTVILVCSICCAASWLDRRCGGRSNILTRCRCGSYCSQPLHSF